MNSNCAIGLAILAASLGACAYTPEYDAPAPAPPVNLTRVYFYPMQGQSEAQQDRDRYDCYTWAVDQTGFDPSRHIAPRETRATVVPARSPGETVAAAAAVGAVIGAATANRGEGGQGALVGALAGTVVGAAVASTQTEDARASEARYNSRGYGRFEREATEYRRAMSACLEGRGYSVR
jgi:uncharacterized protein YcfJ